MPKFISWNTKTKVVEMYCETDLNYRQIANLVNLHYITISRIVRSSLDKNFIKILNKEKKQLGRGIKPPEEGLKRCSLCLNYLELSEFYSMNRDRIDIYQGYCKKCSSVYYKKLNQQRRLKIEVRYNQYVVDAKRRDRLFDLTIDDFIGLWGQPCYYCGELIEGIGIDRVDNSQGYQKSNIVSCCKYCNYAKRNMTRNEYINHCIRVAKHSKINSSNLKQDDEL